MSPLLNVPKFLDKFRKEHRSVQKQTFRQVSETFENLRKSSEIFESPEISGKNRKMSQSAKDDLPAFFMKSSEVIGNLRNSSDVFGNLRKISEICSKVLKITFQHF